MKILYVVVLFFQDIFGSSYDVKVIADYIQSMERPASLSATVCWNFTKRNELFVALTSDYYRTMTYIHINEIPKQHHLDSNNIFIIDLNCPNITQFFKMRHEALLFRAPFRWLIVGAKIANNEIVIPEELVNIEILPDTEVTVAYEYGKGIFSLYCFYQVSAGSEWRSENYGSWNSKDGLTVSENMKVPHSIRRRDLNGLVISVCYVVTDNNSLNHLMDRKDDHIDTITKVNFPTTNHLLDFINAGRKYVFANTWGYFVNGSWNGMTGYLVRGEVEIGGSPMFFTSERISFVDYIASPTPTRSKFVFQQPKLSYENNLFLLSFNNSVWYSSIGLLGILLIILYTIVYWEGKKFSNNKKRSHDAGILRANVSDIIIYLFGAACQQGSIVELKGPLGRVVLYIIFMTFIFLYTSYSANIVALLQSSSTKIHNLEDMLHSRIKFGVHDTVFNRYYFSTASEPIRKAIYNTKVAPPGVPPKFITLEEGVQKMQKGLFAFHMETGVGYKFVGKYFHEGEKCGLKEVQYLQVIDPFLAVRKNTPYKEMFKIGLQRIKEHGLQSRENQLLYTKKPKCAGHGGNFVSVSMVDCYPALLVLAYGAAAATAFLLVENFLHRKQNKFKQIYLLHLWQKKIEDRNRCTYVAH